MKRLLVVVLACMATTAFAHVAKKKNTGLIGSAIEKNSQAAYGMAGCGLGSVLFGESENRGGQILAGTTNGLYFNNTFGMSSGTSNCVPDQSGSTAAIKKNMEMFVAANKESLANDIAKSNGDTIIAISKIMGCKDSVYLGAKLQARYENIFISKESSDVSENMFNTVATDRYLLENCKL